MGISMSMSMSMSRSMSMSMTGGSARRALSFFVVYPARFLRLIPSDLFFMRC